MKNYLAVLLLTFAFSAPVLAAEQAGAVKPEAQTEKTEAAKPEAEAAKPVGEVSVFLDAPLLSPMFQDVPVAAVDNEKITLGELNDAISTVHEGEEEVKPVSKIDYKPFLDRLINIKLVSLEAGEMELDEQEDVKAALADNAQTSLREILKARQVKDVKADPAEADKIFKKAVKECKIRSLIFTKEDDAKKAAEDLKKKPFDDVSKKALSDKKAKGGEEGQFIKLDSMLPQVAAGVDKLKAGGVTTPIKVEGGFVVVKVEDIRYPDDKKAKERAEGQALAEKQSEVLKKYFDSLKKKYATIDRRMFKALDFEKGEAEFAKYLSDKRPLVKIKGEKPITVSEFASTLSEKFYHGVKHGIEEKRVNEQKEPALQEMLYKRLFTKEAKRQGLDKTTEYADALSGYKSSLIFGTFIQKVVVPDIKVTEDESKTYYDAHISDFTYPEMLKLYSMAFGQVKDAEDALKKLKEGTDFKWLKANAPGQVTDDPQALSFDGDVVSAAGLPEDLKKTLTGVQAGDYRLHSDTRHYYVIYVKDDTPSKVQPYKEARETTARKVYNDKINKSVQDWADKLRKAHDVKVFITGIGPK